MIGLLRPQRGRAPIPNPLPGDFFVLEFDRESEAFVLRVDDGDQSTYDLGSDIAELQVLFRACTTAIDGEPLQPRQIDRMIDIARELGMAQYIPQKGELVEDRVLSIVPRSAPHQRLKFDDQEDQDGWLHRLR